MKDKWGTIIFAAILLVVIFGLVSRNNSEKQEKAEEQKLEQEKRIQTANTVSAMAEKYNAVTDWKDNFKGRFSFLDSTYTIELQDAIVKTDGRPILFFSGLNDIVQKDGKYYLYFGDLFGGFSGPDILFILEATPDLIKEIIAHKHNCLENYAVISQIKEVEKVRFQLTSTAVDSEKIDVEFAPSNIFIAKGNCIDFVFVGGHKDNLFDTPEKEPEQKTSAWKRIWDNL